jgi:hypothetical protein
MSQVPESEGLNPKALKNLEWLAPSSRLALDSPVPTLSARLSRSVVTVAPTARSMGIFAGCMPKRRSAQSATTPSVVKDSSVVTGSAKGARTGGLLQRLLAPCVGKSSKSDQSPDATTQNPNYSTKSTLLPKRTLPCEWRSILMIRQLTAVLQQSHPEA